MSRHCAAIISYVLLSAGLIGFLQPRASAQVSSSSGFESVSSGVFNNGASLEGWKVIGNEVGVVADPKGAHSGSQYLALTSGRISKTFSTLPGVKYALRYFARGPGLKNWWPGNGNFNDVIGTNNGVPEKMAFEAGEVGQALAFGGGSGIDFGSETANFGTDDFTIDFWIRQPGSATADYAVLEKRPRCDAMTSNWHIRCGPVSNWQPRPDPGQLDLELSDNNNVNLNKVVARKPINDGQFHHAAFVRNSLKLTVYIDGRLDNEVGSPGIARIFNDAPMRAGQNVCEGVDGTRPFVGDLDELGLFNRALSPAEISAIYAAGNEGKYSPISTLMPNFELTVDGVTADTIVLDEAAGSWKPFTEPFTAKDSKTTIELEGNPLSVLFDDIELVNEPSQK